jgi:soluble lytic murein transglycosylase-like protein
MGNAADTIVSKFPTRAAQLKTPVYDYLLREHKRLPYNGTDQDLYMAVFYPAYRRKPVTTAFPSNVQKANPGIKTPQDYINLVNKSKQTAVLKAAEWTALKDTAAALNMSWEPLYKLINFESAWNPKAKNPSSGARGLIQFMPSTAESMGYKGSLGLGMIVLLLGGGYFLARKFNLL